MNKILVTGGAGFIGSHLCEELVSAGNHVICLDNLHTGKKSNISHLIGKNNFIFIEYDVTNPIIKSKIFNTCKDVNQIYNLACPASPKHYQKDPEKTFWTNILGMKNVLDLAENLNARVVQASTSEIYGDPLIHPQTEDYLGNVNSLGPRACYDEGKRAAETLCAMRKGKIDVRIARIFNTYGPRMDVDDGRVISNFIVQALKNQHLTVYGNGKQTRSPCYVSDLVQGLISLMNSDNLSNKEIAPINLGNPEEFSIKEIADKIIKLTNSKSGIKYEPLPQDDPKKRCPDISRARNVLKWQPKVSFEQGLKKSIEYFRTVV